MQALSHGVASVCIVPATNLAALNMSLQNIKHKHADQPTQNVRRPTPSAFCLR